jgi:phosphatidylglycerophosphate synthase
VTLPWDQRLARALVRPLARTGLRPNHVTTLSLALALAGAGVLALGPGAAAPWGAALFVLGRFVDHADGELARLTGRASRFGYLYDYAAGAASSAALFLGLGVGLAPGRPAAWPLLLGAAAGLLAVLGMMLGLAADGRGDGSAGGYPAWGGFELEDGIYLLLPIAWLGWLLPFLVLAAVGQALFCLGLAVKLRRPAPGA